jgi:hypothetical protein
VEKLVKIEALISVAQHTVNNQLVGESTDAIKQQGQQQVSTQQD